MSEPSDWALAGAKRALILGTCNCESPGREPCFMHAAVARALDAARAEGRRGGIEEVYAIVVGPDDARWRSIFGVDLTFKGKVGEYAEKTREKARAAIRLLLAVAADVPTPEER